MRVKILAILRQLVGAREIEVGLKVGDTVGSVLARLAADYPALGERILDDHGNLETFINVFVSGRSIRFLDGLNTSLNEGHVLAIVPPVGGG